MMTRRSFIAAAGAAGIFSVPSMRLFGQSSADNGFIAFVSDTHIREKEADGKPDDPGAAAKLTVCVQKILAKKPYPSAVIFCGDLTDNGRPEQMARFRTLIQPLRDAGILCQLMAGNHDYYAGHHDELFAPELAVSPVPGKVVSVAETPSADIVCLDTPDMVTQDGFWGRIDGAQLDWLKGYIRRNGGKKPYFLCAHHPLNWVPVPAGVDLFRSAAGWICGHMHVWKNAVQDEHGVATVYLPSTRDGSDPESYVEMRRVSDGFSFMLKTGGADRSHDGATCVVKDKQMK